MFEFASPTTLDDAFQLWHARARWFAGGIDVVTELKAGVPAPARLINLKQIEEMQGIAETEGNLRIGALATLREIAENPIVLARYRALADACELSASPQIRNVGTIGGNLNQGSICDYFRGDFRCWLKGGASCFMRNGASRDAAILGYAECVHVNPSDPAVALVALDACISVRGKNGAREIAAAEFCRPPTADNRRLNALQPDEIITNIRLPITSSSRSSFLKTMDRAAFARAGQRCRPLGFRRWEHPRGARRSGRRRAGAVARIARGRDVGRAEIVRQTRRARGGNNRARRASARA